MMNENFELTRRKLLHTAAIAAGAVAGRGLGVVTSLFAQQSEVPVDEKNLPTFTGPSQNPCVRRE